MINAVHQLFDRHPAADRIEAELRVINDTVDAAALAYREACLDVEEGKPDAEKRRKLIEKQRDDALRRQNELTGALAVVRQREAAARLAAERKQKMVDNASVAADCKAMAALADGIVSHLAAAV